MHSDKEGISSRPKYFLPKAVLNHKHGIRFISPRGKAGFQDTPAVDYSDSMNEKYLNFTKDLEKFKLKLEMNERANKRDQNNSYIAAYDSMRKTAISSYDPSKNIYRTNSSSSVYSSASSRSTSSGDRSEGHRTAFKGADRGEGHRTIFKGPDTSSKIRFIGPRNQPLFFPESQRRYLSFSSRGQPDLATSKFLTRKEINEQTLVGPRKYDSLSQSTIRFYMDAGTSKEVDPNNSVHHETYEIIDDSRRLANIGDSTDSSIHVLADGCPPGDDQYGKEESTKVRRGTVLVSPSLRSGGEKALNHTKEEIRPSYRLGIDARKKQLEHLTSNRMYRREVDTHIGRPEGPTFQMKNPAFTQRAEGTSDFEPLKNLARLVVENSESERQKAKLIGKRDAVESFESSNSPKKAKMDSYYLERSNPTSPPDRQVNIQRKHSPSLAEKSEGDWRVIDRYAEKENFSAEMGERTLPCDCIDCRKMMYAASKFHQRNYCESGNSDSYRKPYENNRASPEIDLYRMNTLPEVESIDRVNVNSRWSNNFMNGNECERKERKGEGENRYENRHNSFRGSYDEGRNETSNYAKNEISPPYSINFERRLSYNDRFGDVEQFQHKREIVYDCDEIPRSISSKNSVIEYGSKGAENISSPPRLIGSNPRGVRSITMYTPEMMLKNHNVIESKKEKTSNPATKNHVTVTYCYPKKQRLLHKGESGVFYESVEYHIYNKKYQAEGLNAAVGRGELKSQRSRTAESVIERARMPQKRTGLDSQPTFVPQRPGTGDSVVMNRAMRLSAKDRHFSLTDPISAASPSTASLETEREIDETDSALSISDSEEEAAGKAGRMVSAPKKLARGPRLYRFLVELLEQPDIYPCVQWINKEERMFKFVDSDHVAKLWGKRKNRPHMKYENFARSLRCYKNRGILHKPRQKLVYQFAEGW